MSKPPTPPPSVKKQAAPAPTIKEIEEDAELKLDRVVNKYASMVHSDIFKIYDTCKPDLAALVLRYTNVVTPASFPHVDERFPRTHRPAVNKLYAAEDVFGNIVCFHVGAAIIELESLKNGEFKEGDTLPAITQLHGIATQGLPVCNKAGAIGTGYFLMLPKTAEEMKA